MTSSLDKLSQGFQHYCQTRLDFDRKKLIQRIIGDAPRMLIINTLCALLVTYILHTGHGLFENWVFSMCIGITAYTLVSVSKYLVWGAGNPNTLVYYLMCLILGPVAFFIGSVIAAMLFGYPWIAVLHFELQSAGTFITVTIFVSCISAWFFWNRIRMAELVAAAESEKAKAASIERQAMQAQLQLLQAQIEPHMLFNTLANLQGLIAIDPERAQHMLAQLITYLRATLSSSRAESTTLKQEFSLMQAYLELLTIRMGRRLSYQLDLPAEMDTIEIAPMLLQPLVENAIKHGLEPKLDGGHIHVTAYRDVNFLHLQVTDTGLGLPFDYDDHTTQPTTTGHHVGNANIRDRLLALYGSNASLELTAHQPQGTVAHLRIPTAAPTNEKCNG
ncbi:sensor histidine kinase [Undibacterium sp. SXout7W]|uniref:sensor histidine kinase n=1 Tax=Undibacterium sp. SXout7W TaxID=3413049 RepID=UPI003BF34C1B